MSVPEEGIFEEPRTFDSEYAIRLALILVIAGGIVFLAWTYQVKNTVIVSLNESNEKMFNQKFDELAINSSWANHSIGEGMSNVDVSDLRQRMSNVGLPVRNLSGLNPAIFGSLPLMPENWMAVKYAFDGGRLFVLKDINASHYLQPDLYSDWETYGRVFYKNHDVSCRTGMQADPYIQKIYTTHGVTVETYAIVRSSFCVTESQVANLVTVYPNDVETDEMGTYIQNPRVVSRYITVTTSPSLITLGPTYPKFSKNWAAKTRVLIKVADNTPRGVYVVALGLGKYKPLFGAQADVNYNAYQSRNGAPLMQFVLAVD